VIVHAAAQPSHDRAAAVPFDDFDTNAVGTMNMLEAARQACPESPFVHMSTNKVYGDAPNRIAMTELPTRWDYDDPAYADGIPETFTVDQSTHSLFGASKLAADAMVQEYGRYFKHADLRPARGLPHRAQPLGRRAPRLPQLPGQVQPRGARVQDLRLQGQAGQGQHPLARRRAVHGGLRGAPRAGEVYNLGGGKANSTSILEAFKLAESFTGKAQVHAYVDQNRIGDHICYYSDLRKMRKHFPSWDITQSLAETVRQIVESWKSRPHV
jgi:CDP-paratose 2-epimerase